VAKSMCIYKSWRLLCCGNTFCCALCFHLPFWRHSGSPLSSLFSLLSLSLSFSLFAIQAVSLFAIQAVSLFAIQAVSLFAIQAVSLFAIQAVSLFAIQAVKLVLSRGFGWESYVDFLFKLWHLL
jgi:hypothetical protein